MRDEQHPACANCSKCVEATLSLWALDRSCSTMRLVLAEPGSSVVSARRQDAACVVCLCSGDQGSAGEPAAAASSKAAPASCHNARTPPLFGEACHTNHTRAASQSAHPAGG
jgi:hypothetical protein